MANSDKNILITPATNTGSVPSIEFVGTNNTPITLTVDDNGSIAFSNSTGELFKINNSLQGLKIGGSGGYALPASDGATDQILVTDGAGQIVFKDAGDVGGGGGETGTADVETIIAYSIALG